MHAVDIEPAAKLVLADISAVLILPYMTLSDRSRGQDSIVSLGGKRAFAAGERQMLTFRKADKIEQAVVS